MRLFYYILYFIRKRVALSRNIVLVGKSKLHMHPATHLLMKKSKIIIEDGTLKVGIAYGKYGGSGIDPNRDNCRIHLNNSVLHIYGDVSLYPGCRIIANNAEVIIRNGTRINAPTYIIAEKKIEIGENCLISFNVTIRDNDGHQHGNAESTTEYKVHEVVIKNNSWIGQDVILLKGVTVGNGAVISAGSLIFKDVPDYAMVGNHSVVLKENIRWKE